MLEPVITDRSWNFGPFAIGLGNNADPDVMQLYSKKALADAPLISVMDPLPAVGTTVILQVDIPGVFTFDARHVIAPGDTPASVAAALAAFFNNGAGDPDDQKALQDAGVEAGNTPGLATINVTNPNNGSVITLSDASGLTQSVFSPAIVKGQAAWDAGPILALGKLPVDANGKGIPPPLGSCIAQIVIAAYDSTGRTPLQYFTIGWNVLDPVTGECEMAFYTKDAGTKIMSISSNGLIVNGMRLQ